MCPCPTQGKETTNLQTNKTNFTIPRRLELKTGSTISSKEELKPFFWIPVELEGHWSKTLGNFAQDSQMEYANSDMKKRGEQKLTPKQQWNPKRKQT